MDYPYNLSRKIMPGHLVELDRPGPYDHSFGGEQNLRGGECPNCEKPLMLHLTLDTTDPRLNLDSLGVERLRLLYCMRCDIKEAEFVYRMTDDTEIEILDYLEATNPHITEEHQRDWYDECGFSDSFPRRSITLHRMPDRLQELIDTNIDRRFNSEERHEFEELAGILPGPGQAHHGRFNQVGGFGHLWQPELPPYRCMACDKLGLSNSTGFLAVLVNSPSLPDEPGDKRQYWRREFAVCYDSAEIAFCICTYCDAIHAIAVV